MRVSAIVAATALLAAIAYCVLGPYSHMSRIWWIPDWVGNWADRHPFFRNFPPFAFLSFVLFVVVTFYTRLVTRYGRWQLALGVFVATALLGTSLEFLQQLVPDRAAYAHPRQIMWSIVGAFVGAFGSAYIFKLFAPSLPATSNP